MSSESARIMKSYGKKRRAAPKPATTKKKVSKANAKPAKTTKAKAAAAVEYTEREAYLRSLKGTKPNPALKAISDEFFGKSDPLCYKCHDPILFGKACTNPLVGTDWCIMCCARFYPGEPCCAKKAAKAGEPPKYCKHCKEPITRRCPKSGDACVECCYTFDVTSTCCRGPQPAAASSSSSTPAKVPSLFCDCCGQLYCNYDLSSDSGCEGSD
jgi:hypothetical protein